VNLAGFGIERIDGSAAFRWPQAPAARRTVAVRPPTAASTAIAVPPAGADAPAPDVNRADQARRAVEAP